VIIQNEKKLRQISLPCNTFEEGMEIGKQLVEEVVKHSALGLSAIQIGIPKRVFIMRVPSDKVIDEINKQFTEEVVEKKWDIFINPIFTSEHPEKVFYEEGCLSFPGIKVITHRSANIVVTNTTENGIESLALSDLDAIVFQHELDHLNGKLMFDCRAKSVPPSYNTGKDKIGRNDVCPCGSGKKYKKCCGK